jgi:hypothetical protein
MSLDIVMKRVTGIELIEQKIGEAIGLEQAAQKVVYQFQSRGLFKQKNEREFMIVREEASDHEQEMNDLLKDLSASLGLNIQKTQAIVQKTTAKAMKMRDAYLGDKPDRQEALEFLCLAEAAEVIHYEVLRSLSKKFKAKNFGKKIKSILEEEKEHLKFCTKLVKKNIVEQD